MRALTALATLFVGFAVATADAQETYRAPRTWLGHPDMQGVWTNETKTRLERPVEMGDRLILTPEETTDIDSYSKFHPAMRVNGEPRSSFITNPANGQVPPMKPGVKPDTNRRTALLPGERYTDGPELQLIDDRCILPIGNNAGPVMLPLNGNSNYQIIQTEHHVVILVEMIHDARIVRLNGKHRDDGQRPYLGDSIGWWEDETLVVETTNFPPEQLFRGSWRNLKVTERFTRVKENRLLYQFTVDDPTRYKQPWKGEMPLNVSHEPLYEYACHEGNYSMFNMMSGARQYEREGRKNGSRKAIFAGVAEAKE